MNVRELNSKSLLRKYKKVDSWFFTRYGMNIYRGCLHNCIYCDGQAEKYQVAGQFESDIEVKINAPQCLEKEIARVLKKKNKPGYFGLVGGVSDAYQPIEKEYQLTRRVLEILKEKKVPVMILTKSTLVERDLDLLTEMNKHADVIVGMSFSSVNNEISQIFEPGVPLPSERLKTLKRLRKAGLTCGIFLMPLIPFITDKIDKMTAVFKAAQQRNLNFIVASGLTLKPGRQRNNFYASLNQHFPGLKSEYTMIFKENQYGNAIEDYYKSLNAPLLQLSKSYGIPLRIPVKKENDQINMNERVVLILEQLDYLLKLRDQRSPYGYAAHNLSRLKEPIDQHRFFLKSIKGVGKVTEKIVQQIISTGSSAYYEKLLF